MDDSLVKMTYIPAQHRVRVELSKAICLSSFEPPPDLMERAVSKLKHEVEIGNLEFYRFFETRLRRVWKTLRESSLDENEKIGLTLATGAPKIPGILIESVQNKKLEEQGVISLISLSVPPEDMSKWRFKTFKLKVGYILRQNSITETASASQLYGLWYRASQGLSFVHEPLYSSDRARNIPKDVLYSFELTRRGDVVLRVMRVDLMLKDPNFEELISDAKIYLSNVSEKMGFNFKFLTTNIVRNLRSATRGPERFGIDMPLVLLAALNQKTGLLMGNPEDAVSTKFYRHQKLSIQSVLDKCFKIETSDNNAHITTRDKINWKLLKTLTNEQWFSYLRRNRIEPLAAQESYSFIMAAVQSQQKLNAERFASTLLPKQGGEPFFKFSGQAYVDAYKQSLKVTSGSEIGRVHYHKPPENGVCINGNVIYPDDEEQTLFTLGEGVEYKAGIYYALVDGSAEICDDNLKIVEKLVYEGNLNQVSGDFFCTSSAEVNGNVERGVLVHVAGNLHVKGLVEGAIIVCHGKLTIDGGVMAGSYLRSRGDMSIGFSENSIIISEHNLRVRENLMSCEVYVNKNISFESEQGSIMGGDIYWGDLLECVYVGTETGRKTKLYGGGRPYDIYLQQLDKDKAKKISDSLAPMEGDLKELRRRRPEQMGRKLQERKIDLIAAIEKGERLLEKINARIEVAEQRIPRSKDASMKVSMDLSMNCELKLAGKRLNISRSYTSVHVVSGGVDDRTTFLQRSGN